MTSRENILQSIKKSKPSTSSALPNLNIKHTHYENKNKQFSKALNSVGGNAFWLENESIEDFVAKHYQNVKVIASTFENLTCKNTNTNDVLSAHELNNVELAIVEGEFAVAENGAVWVKNPNNKYRALYFLAKQLLIIVKKENIVQTMHEAYEKVSFEDAGYGVFISGPSKTADIEQSLVIGAHGPTDACVLFV
jgi:L-lactate dehydrogenase complex protein LldG